MTHRTRYIVQHLNAYGRIPWPRDPAFDDAKYPKVLEDMLVESKPSPDARLVSLVPAGTHIPSGTYLATWEVES